MDIQEIIDVLEAVRDGKELQWAPKNDGHYRGFMRKSNLDDVLSFLSDGLEIRIKPEPREFTIAICKRYCPNKLQKNRCHNCEGEGNCETIKVIEVL